ncbi:26S proteasome complex subunit [Exophiala xenobiotica]|uniref:26S proteasome complex subunit SEM1 n=1 Tax=Lithohypha guttulata TaxID=1690604 RepID=A0ABR0KE38_9EURO|nr:26S proteasome complex subunit [Lithohypha guttulata]KAK5318338.1 26S proteasome complex subunit [Exophiala xenobiotica]
MSSGDSSSAPTAKLEPTKSNEPEPGKASKPVEKAAAMLEEDDEFEDFPVEDWSQEDATVPGGTTHLWEESWDDDDENDDFSKALREELKKSQSEK